MRIYDESKGGPVQPFVMPDAQPDYHSAYSLTVRELIGDGYDIFGDEGWADAGWPTDGTDDANWVNTTRARIERKFIRKFYFAEIDPRVPAQWRYNVTTTAQLVVPKYAKVYQEYADGVMPWVNLDTYGKNRAVHSEYPAAQLDAHVNDYASTADDFQSENVTVGDFMDKMSRMRSYNDIDAELLSEFERNFSQVLSFTLGGM